MWDYLLNNARMVPGASPSIASSDRILQVLAVLAQQGRPLTAADLMNQTGLARSTLYRQLARLKSWGFVSEVDGSYAPGPLSLQLAHGFDLSSSLMRAARPEMEALAHRTNESVALIVAVNGRAACLDMVDSAQSLRCSFERGRSVPLHTGASARCVLAHLPEATRLAVLEAQYTAGPERDAAQRDLAAIRKAGFAVSEGAVDVGVWGASAAVFASARQAVGAITLMAPTVRSHGREAALTQMTIVAAARISRSLSSA